MNIKQIFVAISALLGGDILLGSTYVRIPGNPAVSNIIEATPLCTKECTHFGGWDGDYQCQERQRRDQTGKVVFIPYNCMCGCKK